MIDGVNVGWTELSKIFRYFSIAIDNCPYSLFGSLYLRLNNTDRNRELIVCTSFPFFLVLIRGDVVVLNTLLVYE